MLKRLKRPKFARFAGYSQLVLLLMLMVFLPSLAVAQNAPLKIVVFGDSLTSGYRLDPKAAFPAMLERQLLSQGYQVRVINMSVPGETSTDGRNRMKSVIDQAPDLVLLEFGANDAIKGIDLGKITMRNLNMMIPEFKGHNIGVLLCGTTPPPNLSKADAYTYTHMFYKLAGANQISLVPNIIKSLHGRPDLTQADKFHPNEKGVLAMVQDIAPTMDKMVKWRLSLRSYQHSQSN